MVAFVYFSLIASFCFQWITLTQCKVSKKPKDKQKIEKNYGMKLLAQTTRTAKNKKNEKTKPPSLKTVRKFVSDKMMFLKVWCCLQ